jgi:two-component system sensor histidine kinase VicK
MILGIDMVADDFLARAQSIFSPVALLLLFLVGVLMAIFVAIYLAKRRIEAMAELDEQRTALMTLTTHQLGAPLATFKWWMEIHKEHEAKNASAENKDDISMLQEGVSRMDAIMKSLQEAYEVFSGDISYKEEAVSLKELIEEVVRDVRPVCDTRKQKLDLNVETVNEKMLLDPKLVKAVIRELIDNAHTYSPENATITVRALKQHGQVEVQVQDEGAGIPAKDLGHIFERFTRGSNAMKLKPVGNGLGLFTAKGIIERAGGKMWVESEEGKGTRVLFTLPVK